MPELQDYRIVSLSPAATELIAEVGLTPCLRGISHDCDHPAGVVRDLPRLTRARVDLFGDAPAAVHARVRELRDAGEDDVELDGAALRELEPDLVITHTASEFPRTRVEQVDRALEGSGREVKIFELVAESISDVFETMKQIASAVDVWEALTQAPILKHWERARLFEGKNTKRVDRVWTTARKAPRVPAICLAWGDPPMVMGHWMPEIIRFAGGRDLLGGHKRASLEVPWERIVEAAPEVILLAPHEAGRDEALRHGKALADRPGWKELPAVRSGRVFALDARAHVSRCSPRLLEGMELVGHLLHPELFPEDPLPGAWQALSP